MRSIVARELADSGCENLRATFLDRIETFAVELALWGSKLNLTAAPDDPAEIAFHVIDSLAPLTLALKAADVSRQAGRSPWETEPTSREAEDGPRKAEQTSGKAKSESRRAGDVSREGGPQPPQTEQTSRTAEHKSRKDIPKSPVAEPESMEADQESKNVETTLWKTEAESLAGAFASRVRVLDLGSGAGFPGLILASACEAEFVLVEARRKRASFLSVTAAAMGLSNVRVASSRVALSRLEPSRVASSRADSTGLEPVFDVVTARAFAEPAVALQAAARALKPGGRAIIYATPAQRAAIKTAVADNFEPPTFIGYELARGATVVPHILAVATRRQP